MENELRLEDEEVLDYGIEDDDQSIKSIDKGHGKLNYSERKRLEKGKGQKESDCGEGDLQIDEDIDENKNDKDEYHSDDSDQRGQKRSKIKDQDSDDDGKVDKRMNRLSMKGDRSSSREEIKESIDRDRYYHLFNCSEDESEERTKNKPFSEIFMDTFDKESNGKDKGKDNEEGKSKKGKEQRQESKESKDCKSKTKDESEENKRYERRLTERKIDGGHRRKLDERPIEKKRMITNEWNKKKNDEQCTKPREYRRFGNNRESMKEYEEILKNTQSKIIQLEKTIDTNNSALQKANDDLIKKSNDMDRLERKMKGMKRDYDMMNSKVEELLRKEEEFMKSMKSSQDELREDYGSLKDEMNKNRDDIEELRGLEDNVMTEIKDFTVEMDDALDELEKKWERKINNVTDRKDDEEDSRQAKRPRRSDSDIPSSYSRPFTTTYRNNRNTNSRPFCVFKCGSYHYPAQCTTYTIAQKNDKALYFGLCFGCLRKKENCVCRGRFLCGYCKNAHHNRALCTEFPGNANYKSNFYWTDGGYFGSIN